MLTYLLRDNAGEKHNSQREDGREDKVRNMPRKSRRSRRAHISQSVVATSTPKEAVQPAKPTIPIVRPAPVARHAQTDLDPSRQFRHLRSDIKRIFISAAICAVVLVVIYFVLR